MNSLLTALATVSTLAAIPVASVDGMTEYALPNGLRVVLVPDATKPTVTVNVTYFVGSRHEGAGERGMAHLLEHLLFKGSPAFKDPKKALAERGGDANGTTWFDRTNYYETMPASPANLAWALRFEADRMVKAYVAKKDLDAEMTVVRNELEMGENDATQVLLDQVMATAFVWHAYGQSTIGPRSDLENVPIEKLQSFYRRFYQPDNALLVVAGQFDRVAALKLIADTFGKIPRPKRALERTYTVEPTQDGERSVTVRRTGGNPLIAVGYHVPAGAHADYAPVAVLSALLGDEGSGRLAKALLETKKAANVTCMDFMLKEPGALICAAQLGQEDAPAPARAALLATLADASRGPFTADEVNRARARLLKDLDVVLNTSDRVGVALSEWAAAGDWRLLFVHRARLERVTPEDVARVARAYLKSSNQTVGEYVPTPAPDRADIPQAAAYDAELSALKAGSEESAQAAFDTRPQALESRVIRKTLASGAQLALLAKPARRSMVSVALAMPYGSETSLAGLTNAGSLLGALLERGTKRLTREAFQTQLDQWGAELHFSAKPTELRVSLEVRRPHLQKALALVVEALKTPALSPSEFDKLKREVLAEISEQESDPAALGSNELQRSLSPWPPKHPLHVPTLRERALEVEALKLDAVRSFHERFYGGQSLEVAMVGDFDQGESEAFWTEATNGWKASEPFVRIKEPFRAREATSRVMPTPDKANAFLGVGLTLPLSAQSPEYSALLMADYLLGGGFLNGRVPMRLREKDGLSYGAGTALRVSRLDDLAFFLGYAMFAPAQVDRVESGMREEWARAFSNGFPDSEVKEGLKGLMQQRTQERASDAALASLMVSQLHCGRTFAFEAQLDERFTSLNGTAVTKAFQALVDLKRLIVIKAGDFKKVATP